VAVAVATRIVVLPSAQALFRLGDVSCAAVTIDREQARL
jgi:hypothetical protein